MRNHLYSLHILLLVLVLSFFGSTKVSAQDYPENVDLGVRLVTELPPVIKINGAFAVQAEVFLDANSSNIPTGETTRARIELLDPSGITIDSYEQLFGGFTPNTNGALSNDTRIPGKVLFQIPWSQAKNWNEAAEWRILIHVSAPSVDTDLSNNTIVRNFTIVVPDLVPTIDSISAVDPITGDQTVDYVPNTNYQVSGTITNIGQVSTQPGVYVPVQARILNASGTILDEEIILMRGVNEFNYISGNGGAWEFNIDELYVPLTEEDGILTLSLAVNPDTLPGGASQVEQNYQNNTISQLIDLTTDEQTTVNQRPSLQFVENSYNGERGTFRGMDPAFISFAVRNSGRAPVGPNDYAKASIYLSKDLVVDKGDFVIREFNLGGDGIGLGLLAGDTVNLTWNQQLPDNYEGDFYLLIKIENGNYENKNTTTEQLLVTSIDTTQLDTTPVFTLLTEDQGETKILQTDSGESGTNLQQLTSAARSIEQSKASILSQKAQFPELGYAYDQQIILLNEQQNEIIAQINALASPAERPDTSKDGRFVVFEKKSPVGDVNNTSFASQQIYLLDLLQPSLPPTLVTRKYGTNLAPEPSTGNSFRPRISYDGDTVVFHSISNDLVPGDTNNKEDVFVYRISTQTMFRAVNSSNDQFNGRSLYPDVNGDGTRIVFESDSTNADLNFSGGGSQIYLWTLDQNSSGSGFVRVLTEGNGESYNPSIDDLGQRVVFHSFANNLVGLGKDTNNLSDAFLTQLESPAAYNNADYFEIKTYRDKNGNSFNQTTFLVNRSYKDEQASGGHSANAKISGNGERIIFESKATNLVSGTGIALVEVIEGGGGYAGNPQIEIFDTPGDFNGSGAPGRGAELAFVSGGINALSEINKDAIMVINGGQGYISPLVRIIPDPDYPDPTLEAKAVAYLGSPEGDIYYVNVADLNGSNTQPTGSLYSHRISQSVENSGGNFGSRDPSIDWNGSKIVYATKSSNLLASKITRDDGKDFFNTTYVLPKARAILVGGIGEIEIESYGMGYEPGALFIEDLSGSGSGAVANYEVDNLGRIVTIKIVNAGENYNLDSTIVGVIEPRGGTGFLAGEIRFPQTLGEGVTRQGGGRIFSVIMEEHGKGYFIGDTDNTFSDIIQFEGDGADLNQDGFPDGRIRPDRVKNLNGSLYIEQRFEVDVLTSGLDLENTTLTISDKNNSSNPTIITFGSNSSSNNNINPAGRSESEIRDEIIDIIVRELEISAGNTNTENSPVIDQNLSGGTSFEFHALSGNFISNNPSAVRISLQSNMLIMGSGYSTVTPVINQVPSIFGYSEVLSDPQFELQNDVGRMTLLSSQDYQSDDIYLYDIASGLNERISKSSFGTPVMYLQNPPDAAFPSPPSSRFPVISGNGRYVFFSSDSWGNEGLAFISSNQFPLDYNPARDLYFRDLKTMTIIEEDIVSSVEILYPNNNLSHSYSSGSSIPIIADVQYSGVVGRLGVFVNQQLISDMEEFGGGLGQSYRSNRFTYSLTGLNAGEYSLQLVAYGMQGQVLATSALIRFEVSSFNGSLPPDISMRDTTVFSSLTSTSVIPLSARSQDPDGTVQSVAYYVDGVLLKQINRLTGVSETDQSFPILFDVNQTIDTGENQGFRTIFAVARDNSGNYVASDIHNISFTTGSTPPSVAFTRGFNGLKLEASDLNFTNGIKNTGEILQVSLTNGAVGKNLVNARINISGSGYGAEIKPIIDLNISSATFGMLTEFVVEKGGLEYDSNTSFYVIPVVRSINEGIRAELEYIYNPPADINATSRSDDIASATNPDGSLKLGNGYVTSPRLRLTPDGGGIAGFDRLPLEETDAPFSRLLPVDLSITLDADRGTRGAEILGGFTQSPIIISVEANASDELIEFVSLVINGEVDIELTKFFPDNENSYNFAWAPSEPGEYSVATTVRDFAGNIVSTEENIISIENYSGSGVNLSLGDVFNYEVEGNGQLYLQVDATSEYGILYVEFYIDSQFVGKQVSNGTSSFQQIIDLSDPQFNFRQGGHEITIIAYDKLGNIAGTFSRTITNLTQRTNPFLNILPPLVKDKPEISLIYPLDEITLTKGSSIRFLADANDSNGDLRGVRFYQNSNSLDAWAGILDFNNTLPVDGSTITIFDGTSNQPVTFEFDDNDSVFGGGVPVVVPSTYNQLNDLSVEGNFSYPIPIEFLIEIDREGSTSSVDSYRWSLDGGLTFVNELIEITPGVAQALGFGLSIKFSKDDGHALGDRWSFIGRPLHQVVGIATDSNSPTVNILRTRDKLKAAIEYSKSLDLLSVRSLNNSSTDQLFLAHALDNLVASNVTISGTALASQGGTILFSNNDYDDDSLPDNFILPQTNDSTLKEPFGITWEANDTGSFLIFAIARDSNGAAVSSASRLVNVISSLGELPIISLDKTSTDLQFSGSNIVENLSAIAHDPDGSIAEVSFYGNGVLIESDTSRPYSATFEMNASGHYEVYAVARDNSGNLVTSNVRRIVVDGSGEEPEQPLILTSSMAFLGGNSEISAIYKSEDGNYDDNLRAMIYLNGRYLKDAQKLPRMVPGPGEDDSGQSFLFDLDAHLLGMQEIEMIILDGNKTASGITSFSVAESALTDDMAFINMLYDGLFKRLPEGFENGQFYGRLEDGTLTREQAIEEISRRTEFIKARNMLLVHKTMFGEWRDLGTILSEIDPTFVLDSTDPTTIASYATRPDDAETDDPSATLVGMNQVVRGVIETPSDIDTFRITSLGPNQNGLLTVTLESGHPGVALNDRGPSRRLVAINFLTDESVDINQISDFHPAGEGYGTSGIVQRTYDLRGFTGSTDWEFYLRVEGNPLQTGPYALIFENRPVLVAEETENFFQNLGQVPSAIMDYNFESTIGYLTSKFEYFNQYGTIGTHDPEELFTRLYKNKYEQMPSPRQIVRATDLIADVNRTQFEFAHQFILENKVITQGAYNYTQTESNSSFANLAIPNVPHDIAAFADTALVYLALLDQAPTNAQVAKLTLNPEYELRPMTERAQMIMEMPGFASRFGLAIPEIDLPNLLNGRTYREGYPLLIDAASLGPDNLGGTLDDGYIREIKILFNGSDHPKWTWTPASTVSDSNISKDGFYFNLSIPDLPIGEYLVEVFAEDKNGLISRSQRSIYLGSSNKSVSLTSPVIYEALDIDDEVDFKFELSDPSMSAYLEINGRIPWIGHLAFNATNLPADGSSITIADGADGNVTFEFDSDLTPSSTVPSVVERMHVHDDLNITTVSTYQGTEYREYLVEIDGNGTGPNGHDTFRWSINGGESYNNSGIEIDTDLPSTLSAGIVVDFDSNDSYEVLDRWRIKAYPANEIIQIGRFGSFEERLSTTRKNFVDAINRVNNEGKLALRAKASEADSTSTGWFNSLNQNKYGIQLRRSGFLPAKSKLNFNSTIMLQGNTTLSTSDWLEQPWKTSGGTSTINTLSLDLHKMGFVHPSLEARIVAMDENTTIYSEPRVFVLRDPARLSIELGDPVGRKASVRIVGDITSDGSLTNNNFQVLDGGAGYTAGTAQLSIISEDGRGASLRPVVNQLGELASVEVVSPGSGYTLSDLVLISSPLQYKVGDSVSVSAKVRDPLSELDRVAFYVNGVELDENSTSGSGSTYSASYEFIDESAKFVTARALYGDDRDRGPSTIAEDEWMHGPGISGDRINYWGWRRHWAEQHFHGPGYVFPEWFIQDQDYWALPPPWLSLPYGPGAVPVQVNAEPEKESISIAASSNVDMGQVGLLGLTYRSVDGDYDDDLKVSVYVDDQFAGYATMLEYEEPEFWEEDPGYQFEFVLPVHTSGTKEVEFYILDGDRTFSAYTSVNGEESPLTDHYQFLKQLWNGIYDRDPVSAEINAYLASLGNGSMNRSQVIEHLRTSKEFIEATKHMLVHKTLHGTWEKIPVFLTQTNQTGIGTGNANKGIPVEASRGDTFGPIENNATDFGHYNDVEDDHSNLITGASFIGMNVTDYITVLERPADIDYFRIKSQNLEDEGTLRITLNRNIGGGIVASNLGLNDFDINGFMVLHNDGSFSEMTPIDRSINDSWINSDFIVFDLNQYNNVDSYVFPISHFGSLYTNRPYLIGGVSITLQNDAYLDQSNFLTEEEIERLEIASSINDFNANQAILYETDSFSYKNRYGAIETHDPASFFHRLFLNKYDQEPNPMQVNRGVDLLTDGNFTQLQFLQDFATENNIITVGGYNYTTSEAELAIPNVPIDAATFAETALIYSALLDKAPSNGEVASLTLDPYFEVRSLEERAQMILDMPGYAAQYSVSIPRVDFLNVQNGMVLGMNDFIKVEAFDHGIDGTSGTFDDGQIATVSLLLNGSPLEEKEGNRTSSEYTFDFNQSATGEYDLEVVAHNVQGEKGRAHRRVFIGTRNSTISIDTPSHGAVLSKSTPAGFTFSTENVDLSNGTGYLEINGKIRWSGAISITDDLMVDESSLTFHDGANRGAVTFEMDANESASSYEIHSTTVRQLGEGNVTASGTYTGPAEGLEYWVIIDNNGTTFKWMEVGAMEPNATAVAISTDINYTDLGYGIQVNFDSNNSYAFGDAWKIVVNPTTDLVEVETEGSFEDRLARTKRNLITAINRANSEGLLALRADDPIVDNRLAGRLPVSMAVNRAVVLRHDGSYPIITDLNISTSAGGIVQQDMFSLVQATGAYNSDKTSWDLTHSNWDALELCDGLLEVRLIHITDDGNISYSNKRTYPLVDPSRGYVELIGPMGTVYEPGRLPTLHFSDGFSGSLPTSNNGNILVVDGGAGYRLYDEESKDLIIVSSSGSGGNLQIQEVSSATEQVKEAYANENQKGYGYHSDDVIVPSPPAFFNKNENIDLSARLRDPYGQYDRVAFYQNGVGLNSTVQDRSGGVFGTTFFSDLPGDKFITARALYGDSRDRGPSVPHTFGKYPCASSQYAGKDHWGWKKSWLQQHYASGQEFLPSWFGRYQSYWINQNSWAKQPMWDGAAPIRIGEKDVYEHVVILIDSGSPAFKGEKLHSQTTQVDASVQWSAGKVPTLTSVHLYGNKEHLAEITIETNDPYANNIPLNFTWFVNYKDFKDDFGEVDLKVVAVTEEGRQITSGIKRAYIRELSINDPQSMAAMLLKDITGESPSDAGLAEMLSGSSLRSISDIIKRIVDSENRNNYEYMANLVAAYYVLFGNYPDQNSFETDFENWGDEIRQNNQVGLMNYISDKIINNYTAYYGAIPNNQAHFFGYVEGINLSKRKEFVTRHYKNKYGSTPTFIQVSQGANKMWLNRELGNIGAASDFIFNLAMEPIQRVGITGAIELHYLNGMKSHRSNYVNKAKEYPIQTAMNQVVLGENYSTSGSVGTNRIMELDEIDEDPNLRRRFNLLWEDSSVANGLNYWKHEPWFGHFMDEKYPWIYHVDLGWLYSNGTTQKNIWFYSESLGWFWTNREIFKDHPNLSSENQRFIYRVRANKGGAWEGSWSLLTLPIAGTGSTEINLYDYGYNPF